MWEGGFSPPTVGSFFIFRLENVQSWAYLRRKFRLDDMYYIITCMELKISHGLILLGALKRLPKPPPPTSTPVKKIVVNKFPPFLCQGTCSC